MLMPWVVLDKGLIELFRIIIGEMVSTYFMELEKKFIQF